MPESATTSIRPAAQELYDWLRARAAYPVTGRIRLIRLCRAEAEHKFRKFLLLLSGPKEHPESIGRGLALLARSLALNTALLSSFADQRMTPEQRPTLGVDRLLKTQGATLAQALAGLRLIFDGSKQLEVELIEEESQFPSGERWQQVAMELIGRLRDVAATGFYPRDLDDATSAIRQGVQTALDLECRLQRLVPQFPHSVEVLQGETRSLLSYLRGSGHSISPSQLADMWEGLVRGTWPGSNLPRKQSVAELQTRAEAEVRRLGHFPGLRGLARNLGCPVASLSEAVKRSTYLRARRAEHNQRGGVPHLHQLADADLDRIHQTRESNPDDATLDDLIKSQNADRRADARGRVPKSSL